MCAAASALAFLIGCAPYTKPIAPDHKRDAGRAYIYGQFHIDSEPEPVSFGGRPIVAFSVKCRDEKSYGIRFSHETPLQVIEVAPGACQLDEIIFMNEAGKVYGGARPSFRLLQNELLDPGGVYYVGDFFAKAESSLDFKVIYSKRSHAWRFTDVKDNYGETTSEMRRTYAAFASVATEDRMPPRP